MKCSECGLEMKVFFACDDEYGARSVTFKCRNAACAKCGEEVRVTAPGNDDLQPAGSK